jgi:hypothetical protein
MRCRRGGNVPAVVPPRPGGSARASAGRLRGILLCVVMACVALLACTAAASAANYDLRGEWAYTMTCSNSPACERSEFHGIAVIKTMEASGAYSGTQTFEMAFPGTASGIVDEDTLSMLITVFTSPQQTFSMPEGTIDPATNEFSGSGSYNGGGSGEPIGMLTGKRLRSLKQIEEQEEKEKLEREGREKGEAEGRPIGEKKGMEKGEQAGREKGETEGRLKGAAEGAAKAELEVKQKSEQETKERQAKEAQAETEREAKEKTEKEAAEKADAQAREKIEREAREKVEKEAKERKLAEEKRKKKPKHKPKHKSSKGAKATHARR